MRKYLIFTILLVLWITGCDGVEQREAFKNVEDVVTAQQINIHFDWRDEKLEDGILYDINLLECVENDQKYAMTRTQLVENRALGFSITVSGNSFKFQDLYCEENKEEYSSHLYCKDNKEEDGLELGQSRYDLFANASWKLEPLLDEYHIYIDDFIVKEDNSNIDKIKPLELFRIIDENSGTQFTYTLRYIQSYE